MFSEQPKTYQEKVLGHAPRVTIEMASSFGWQKWIGDTGFIIALDTFGASANASDLIQHFKFTPSQILKQIQLMQKKK